jgi:serine/threonine protein kinase
VLTFLSTALAVKGKPLGVHNVLLIIVFQPSTNNHTLDEVHQLGITYRTYRAKRFFCPHGTNAILKETPWIMEQHEPAHPIPFPPPVYQLGIRTKILVDAEGSNPVLFENVLRRDYSGGPRTIEAYSKVPWIAEIVAIGGRVEICNVLTADLTDNIHDDGDLVFHMTDRFVAVKVCGRSRMDAYNLSSEDREKEIGAMQVIGNDSNHVVRCIAVLLDTNRRDDGEWNIVTTYGGKELYHLTKNQQLGKLQEEQARRVFRQIVSGVQHMHEQGVCHLDLSPENVICTTDNPYTCTCIVIDMGIALRVPYTDPMTGGVTDRARGTEKRMILPQGRCGKSRYRSPEMHQGETSFDGEKSDVWSLGTLLYFMVTGFKAYETADESDKLFSLITGQSGVRVLFRLIKSNLDININLSDPCLDLLQAMLTINLHDRPTLEEIANHAWLNGNA